MMSAKLKRNTANKLKRLLNDQSPDKTHLLRAALKNPNVVRVNAAGSWGNYPQFGIVDPYDSLLQGDSEDPRALAAFKDSMVLNIRPPGTWFGSHSRYGGFGITCEPIRQGRIGKAWFSGFCVVRLNVLYRRHRFAEADIPNNEREHLVSSRSGPCKIVWKEDTSGTGVMWAIVYHSGMSAYHYWPQFAFVRLTNVETHPMKGRVQQWSISNKTIGNEHAQDEEVNVYRYPTFTNNDLYEEDNIVSAVRMHADDYVALHSIPIQFAVDTYLGF